MRIIVATGAIQILPVINDRGLWLELRRLLVTIGARNRNVPARQHEVRLLVLGQAERGRLVSLEVMAAVARIKVGRRRKLPRMLVRVTIHAAVEFDLEQRLLPLRDVTLRAFQTRMPALQRIRARGVLLRGKG